MDFSVLIFSSGIQDVEASEKIEIENVKAGVGRHRCWFVVVLSGNVKVLAKENPVC